jgi:hypothetical protein
MEKLKKKKKKREREVIAFPPCIIEGIKGRL